MRTSVSSVVLFFASFLVACGSAEPEPAPPPDTAVRSDDLGAGGTVSDTPAPAGPCSAGGAPDDGDAEGCNFRVTGCCYDTAEQACAAAGCAMSSCTTLESYPAQVRCE